jgi:DNA-binding HxlR family transcriptional regulator
VFRTVVGRSYNQYCGVAHALDLVGERWGMLIVRELLLGPKRFVDLRHGLPGIGTSVLAARLRQLEADGLVARRTLPPPAGSAVYELTDYGRELEPALLAFGRWGARTLGPRQEGQTLRSEWLAVALRAFFRPDAASGLRATIHLGLTDGSYTVQIRDGALQVEPGAVAPADLAVSTDEETLIAFLAGRGVGADELEADGDVALLERLPNLFAFDGQRAPA